MTGPGHLKSLPTIPGQASTDGRGLLDKGPAPPLRLGTLDYRSRIVLEHHVTVNGCHGNYCEKPVCLAVWVNVTGSQAV